jgi:hypothetical protein
LYWDLNKDPSGSTALPPPAPGEKEEKDNRTMEIKLINIDVPRFSHKY